MKLLFVCVENSCRSQMAEAFASSHGADVQAYSAGSRPSGGVNPRAVQFMAEVGLDLGRQRSQGVSEIEKHGPFDAVVTMGCGDACPWVPARVRLDWDLDDPKDLSDRRFREIRDDIGRRVTDLVTSIRTDAGTDS